MKSFELDKVALRKASMPNLWLVLLVIVGVAIDLYFSLNTFWLIYIFCTLYWNRSGLGFGIAGVYPTLELDSVSIKALGSLSLAWDEIDWSLSEITEERVKLYGLKSWQSPLLFNPKFYEDSSDLFLELQRQVKSHPGEKSRDVYQIISWRKFFAPWKVKFCIVYLVVCLLLAVFVNTSVAFCLGFFFLFFEMIILAYSEQLNGLHKPNSIELGPQGVFIDESHYIKWQEIDWSKSKLGSFSTVLVHKEGWRNKVKFSPWAYGEGTWKSFETYRKNSSS